MRRAEELDLTAEGWLVAPYMPIERYAHLGASMPVQGPIFILPRMGASSASLAIQLTEAVKEA